MSALKSLTFAVALLAELPASSNDSLTLRLEGDITQQRAREFELLMSQGTQVSEILLNSGGGDELAAIRIGHLVRKNNINARVSGKCLSACFQYVFLQASRKIIGAGSIVAFHSNSKSANDWIRNSNIDFSANKIISEYYKISYNVEKKILSSNYDENILYAMEIGFRTLKPRCFISKRIGKSQVSGILFQQNAAVPTKQMLDRLGVLVEGAWPKNKNEILKLHKSNFSNINNVTIVDDQIYKLNEAKEC